MRGTLKYLTLIGIVVVVALGLAVGMAPAHSESFRTDLRVVHSQVDIEAGKFVAGILRSPRQQCLPGRTVKLIALLDNDPVGVLDVTRSSENGAWGLKVGRNEPKADDAMVKVTRADVGPGDHDHICKPDSEKGFFG
jgi:hypothetical protein